MADSCAMWARERRLALLSISPGARSASPEYAFVSARKKRDGLAIRCRIEQESTLVDHVAVDILLPGDDACLMGLPVVLVDVAGADISRIECVVEVGRI